MTLGEIWGKPLKWLLRVGSQWEKRRSEYRGLILLFDDFQIVILFLLNAILFLLVSRSLWVRIGVVLLVVLSVLVFVGRMVVSRLRPLPLHRKWECLIWSHYGGIVAQALARSAKQGKIFVSYLPFVGRDFEGLVFRGGYGRYMRYAGSTPRAPDFVICDIEYLPRLQTLNCEGRGYEVVELSHILRRPLYLEELKILDGTSLGGAIRKWDEGSLLAAPLRWGVNGVAVRGNLPARAKNNDAFVLNWLGSAEAQELKSTGRLRVLVPASAVNVIQLVSATLNPNDPARVPMTGRTALKERIQLISKVVSHENCITDPLRLLDVLDEEPRPEIDVVLGGGSWILKSSEGKNRKVEVLPVQVDDGGAVYLAWCEILAFLRPKGLGEDAGHEVWREDASSILDWILGRGKLHLVEAAPGPIHSFPACSFPRYSEGDMKAFKTQEGCIMFPAGVRLVVRSLPPGGGGTSWVERTGKKCSRSALGVRGGWHETEFIRFNKHLGSAG